CVIQDLSGNYEEALAWHFQAVQVFDKVLAPRAYEWATLYSCIGIVYDFMGDLNLALDYQHKALDILQHFPEKKHQTANCYNNIGILHRLKGDYIKALKFQKKAMEIRLNIYGKQHPNVGASFANMGVLHRHMGEFDEALEYFHQSMQVRKAAFGEKHRRVASSYDNIASIYKERGDLDNALWYARKALEIRESIWQGNHPDLAVSYKNLSSLYNIRGEYATAFDYLQKAEQMWSEIYGNQHHTTATVLDSKGKMHRNRKQFSRALPFLRQALQLRLSIFGQNHPATAESYATLGGLFKLMEQADSAKYHLQQAISIRLYLQERDHFQLMNHYYQLSQIAFQEEDYLLAAEWSDKAVQKLNQVRCRYLSSGTKQVHLSHHYHIFENAITTYLKLADLCPEEGYDQMAFSFAEKAKGNLLLESFKNVQAKSFAGIPNDLLQREYDLGIELSYYEQKRFQESNHSQSNDSLLAIYNDQIFQIKQDREILIRQFESNYPDYYRLKYDAGVASVSSIQQQLAQEQTLIEYFIGDENIYVFLISAKEYRIEKIPKTSALQPLIQDLRQSLTAYHQSGQKSEALFDQSNDVFTESAHELFKTLIQPLGSLSQELIIVPDGILGHLPFEILLQEKPAAAHHFGSHLYLINDYTIAYNFSATLWQLMRQKKYHSDGLLSMAPSFPAVPLGNKAKEGQRRLGPLVHNRAEMKAVQGLLGGKNLGGAVATLSQFKQHAPNYKFIHLATHAQLEDKDINYSFLAFSPSVDSNASDKLFIRDLYDLRLSCDMVVLSACETGVGEWQSGEGIVSLARGFAYAGAKSIITSLWSANDRSTAQIMESFYTNLKAGLSKKEALRQAKLQFLSSQKDPLNTHPFYWATFVPIGDLETSINTASYASTSWLWCLVLTGSLLFLGWLPVRLKRR
ncbi:MAG: CHAT domain-containing protein, partial [Cyanothece sp. SIO1E1]|nr:CHAT domain-containing protein [Cyanothece sp. SIO1E1]